MMHLSSAQAVDPCNKGSHSFTCHPHTNHTCLTPQLQGVTALWLVHSHPSQY